MDHFAQGENPRDRRVEGIEQSASAPSCSTSLFSRPFFFWAGVLAIISGVLTHVPMFYHCASMGYRMAGMPMDPLMIGGMFAIVGGCMLAFWGLLPRRVEALADSNRHAHLELHAIDDAPLRRQHWALIATITVAVIVDVMKPATLGFVVPGMAKEYGLTREVVALFPLSALIGTTVGSFVWGVLADRFGRRASILLSALMFMGASICGAMPTFEWNMAMCFLMGASAGGLLPIAFTLLCEVVPAKHRGWSMVLVGTVGTAGGYLAATANAALLEPLISWRALWFAGVPTGLALIVLNRFIPESPRFLWLHGRISEARRLLVPYGVTVVDRIDSDNDIDTEARASAPLSWTSLFRRPLAGLTIGLTFCGVAWGLVNFGFLLWLPANLRAAGLDPSASNVLLAKSALLALPATLLVAWMYHRWSSKNTLILFSALTAISLSGFVIMDVGAAQWPWLFVSMIVGVLISAAAVIAVLLPYSVEIFPLHVRGRGAGLVAGSSKLGGVIGVGLGVASVIGGLGTTALLAAVPIAVAAVILNVYAVETRGQRLDEISPISVGSRAALATATERP